MIDGEPVNIYVAVAMHGQLTSKVSKLGVLYPIVMTKKKQKETKEYENKGEK